MYTTTLCALAMLLGMTSAVIYGEEVEPRSMPWLGVVWGSALTYKQQICGATLIAPNWALSDAQCMAVYAL